METQGSDLHEDGGVDEVDGSDRSHGEIDADDALREVGLRAVDVELERGIRSVGRRHDRVLGLHLQQELGELLLQGIATVFGVELADEELADESHPTDGTVGDAGQGTAEKGAQTTAHQVAGFIQLLRDVQAMPVPTAPASIG